MNEMNHNVLNTVFGRSLDMPALCQGLTAIAQFPPLDLEHQTPPPYRDKRFTPAVMGIKFFGKDMKIAVAARGAKPHYIPADKFIAMVELMNDLKHCTVVLQAFSVPAEKREGRPQILGRILPAHSAINIAYGKVGVPIYDHEDILHLDSFQIDRTVLGAYYQAAKFQIGNEDKLDSLIAAYEGLRFYELPSGGNEAVDMTNIASLLG